MLKTDYIYLNTKILPHSAKFMPMEPQWMFNQEAKDNANKIFKALEDDDVWLDLIVQWTNYRKEFHIVGTTLLTDKLGL